MEIVTKRIQKNNGELLVTTSGEYFVKEGQLGTALSPLEPGDLDELSAWFDASDEETVTVDGSNNVSQWNDKSGNDNHATQDSLSNQPVYDSQEGNVVFTDEKNLSSSPLLSDTDKFEVFGVIKHNDTEDNSATFAQYSSASSSGRTVLYTQGSENRLSSILIGNFFQLEGTPEIERSIYRWSRDVQDGTVWIDGESKTENDIFSTALSDDVDFQMGGNPNNDNYTDVEIQEVVIFTRVLTDTERRLVEGILAHKWDLTDKLPNSHPWRYEQPVKLDDALLDDTPSSQAAYSLRRLNSSYGGPLVRVRRVSDNEEMDFYQNTIEDGTIEKFSEGGDVRVVKWYDQGLNDNDAEQSSASEQPLIVSNGTVITENGKPSVEFLSGQRLTFPFINIDGSGTPGTKLIAVANANYSESEAGLARFLETGTVSFPVLGIFDETETRIIDVGTLGVTDGLKLVSFITSPSSEQKIRINGSEVGSATYDNWQNNTVSSVIFGNKNGDALNTVQEYLLYSPDTSIPDISVIENEVNSYYGVY